MISKMGELICYNKGSLEVRKMLFIIWCLISFNGFLVSLDTSIVRFIFLMVSKSMFT